MDRISELPKDIIHHIYSFLPAKDVLNTSRLSNLWHSIFLSYPCIDLDQSLFSSRGPNGAQSDIENDSEFSKYVNDSIRRLHEHNLDIKKFRLSFEKQKFRLYLTRDEWEVKNICQSIKEVLGFCRNIRDLELYNCVLERCLPEEGVNFPCLNKLSLKRVELDEFTLKKLLKSCPELSDFSYEKCDGLKRSLLISGLTKLKNLKVVITPNFYHNGISVAIDAPTLESLHINGGYSGDVELVIGINLKSLVLESGKVFNAEFVENILSKSPDLESLSLDLCNLHKLNIKAQNLKSLKIGASGDWDLRDYKIHAPNLQTFSYTGCSPHEICFVSAARCWWRIELELSHDFHRLSDLKQCLQGKKIKYLTISIDRGSVTSRKKVSTIPPCCEVEHLRLQMNSGSFEKIILGLVSMCQPKYLNVECGVPCTSFLKGVSGSLMANERLESWNIERKEERERLLPTLLKDLLMI